MTLISFKKSCRVCDLRFDNLTGIGGSKSERKVIQGLSLVLDVFARNE